MTFVARIKILCVYQFRHSAINSCLKVANTSFTNNKKLRSTFLFLVYLQRRDNGEAYQIVYVACFRVKLSKTILASGGKAKIRTLTYSATNCRATLTLQTPCILVFPRCHSRKVFISKYQLLTLNYYDPSQLNTSTFIFSCRFQIYWLISDG